MSPPEVSGKTACRRTAADGLFPDTDSVVKNFRNVKSDIIRYNLYGIFVSLWKPKTYRTMKFFIDTANLEQIRKAHELGVLDGVTTNPSLMAKENIRGTENCNRHYVEICNIVEGDVSACACGASFVTGSTKKELRVDVCSKCHPFFTGQQRNVAARGRIEKFNKRYNKEQ